MQLLQAYLTALDKEIRPVERDGLCIFNSVRVVLAEKGVDWSVDELKEALQEEIKNNSYDSFSGGAVTDKELEIFLGNPEKEYARPCVDLFLPALMLRLKMKGKVG